MFGSVVKIVCNQAAQKCFPLLLQRLLLAVVVESPNYPRFWQQGEAIYRTSVGKFGGS